VLLIACRRMLGCCYRYLSIVLSTWEKAARCAARARRLVAAANCSTRGTHENKQKTTDLDLDVVGWLVPRRPKKYQGWSILFGRFVCRVFGLPSPRSAQKRDKTKIEQKSGLDLLSIFLQKLFDAIFCKTFFFFFNPIVGKQPKTR
jgi:hypothetical protein